METVTAYCKNSICKNEWYIRVVKRAGETKYGWWVIKCSRCNKVNELYIGLGVYDSLLISGGTILLRLDSETNTEEMVKERSRKLGTT